MNAFITSLDLNGPQGKLNNVFYPALGTGAKPMLVFAHGFPGHEKNFTLAQDLRERGFHVLIFFYSGCWGSQGFFSFRNSIDDVNAVLDYLLAHAAELKSADKCWSIDPENIYILGHSVGCLPAATAALRKQVRGCIFLMPTDLGSYYLRRQEDPAFLRSMQMNFEEASHFINGPSSAELLGEIEKHPERYSFIPIIDKLVKKHVLWISGKHDQVADEKHFTKPYRDMLAGKNPCRIEWRSLQTDHYFSNARPRVVFEITSFLTRTMKSQRDVFTAQQFPEMFQRYIDTRFSTATLQDAADWFGISVSYLSSLVRKHFGETFSASVTKSRMNKASELLLYTDMSLTEIAEFLGYNDPSYFMKVFKKYYGTTPTEFKRGSLES